MNLLLKYGAALAVVLVAMFGAYHHGAKVTAAEYQGRIDKAAAQHAALLASKQAEYRALEQSQADKLAAIDQSHLLEIKNREIISNRVIADLRAGAIRLRDRFATCQSSAGMPTTGAGTGQRDAAAGIGFQREDFELVLREASRADAVADQLRACQAVVRADREGQ